MTAPRYEQETIHIDNLRVACIIGVRPHEREHPQPLLISVALPADFGPAAASEELGRTIDYGEVGRAIRAFVVQGRFQLLETLARRLAEHLGEQFNLPELVLKVCKPLAVGESDGAAVSLRYVRKEGRP